MEEQKEPYDPDCPVCNGKHKIKDKIESAGIVLCNKHFKQKFARRVHNG
jgi:hypothetical protein